MHVPEADGILGLRHLWGTRVSGVPVLHPERRPHRPPDLPPGDGRGRPSRPRWSRCCGTSSGSSNRGAGYNPTRADGRVALDACVREPGEPRAPAPVPYVEVNCCSMSARGRAGRVDGRSRRACKGRSWRPWPVWTSCTGASCWLMGNEHVFLMFAEQNVAMLQPGWGDQGHRQLPALLQHARERVPDSGGQYEVIHHSELLARLVREGRWHAPRERSGVGRGGAAAAGRRHSPRLVLLARHNEILAGPRELAAAVGDVVEMERSGKQTFCCGAGGAHMWMEERAKPINVERVREAAVPGADTLAVACPYCAVMLDEGSRARASNCASPTSRRCSPNRSSAELGAVAHRRLRAVSSIESFTGRVVQPSVVRASSLENHVRFPRSPTTSGSRRRRRPSCG